MSRRRGIRRSRSPMLMAFWIAAGVTLAILAAVVALVAVGGGSGPSTGFTEVPSDYPYPVKAIARMPTSVHFPLGEVRNDYNSNPPTSGDHAAAPASLGISDVPVSKEMAVHNMEHAGVVVWFNCNAAPALSSDGCTQLRNQLGEIVAPAAATTKVLMTPYEGMEQRIALTAWGFLDVFDEFDAERVRKFIETFECNYNPEGAC